MVCLGMSDFKIWTNIETYIYLSYITHKFNIIILLKLQLFETYLFKLFKF